MPRPSSKPAPPAKPSEERIRYPRLKARADRIRERRATAGKTTVEPRAEPESSGDSADG